jgi:uncharacterized LabA/DUF88 family protein
VKVDSGAFFYYYMGDKVAILVDGSFFLKRYNQIITNGKNHSASIVASELTKMCWKHLDKNDSMYRIFYYDCLPLTKSVVNPVTNERVHYSQSKTNVFRNSFINELKKQRKVAVRLGTLKSRNEWIINPKKTKDLLKGKIKLKDLVESDVKYSITQKTVDIKIGIDIASLVLKKHISKIVLVSGDGDFIPASKLARREGIDFVLDHMGVSHIDDSLFEHIDGIKTTLRPYKKKVKK